MSTPTTPLKAVSPAVQKHVSSIWAKSVEVDGKAPHADNPTYPYLVTGVEQITPTREQVEAFETKRNALDRKIAPKKLETINCFYNPTSEGLVKKILQNGWKDTFQMNPEQLLLFSNANIAASHNKVMYHKMFIVRVTLGLEGSDYNITEGKQVKIKDLDSIISSFLVVYRNSLDPTPPQSPVTDRKVSSASTTPTKTTTTTTSISSPTTTKPGVTPGGLMGDGIICPSCQRQNAGNTRYCIRCGANL
ncbi:hypothetical protein CYY_003893 [Polysphondylium violaceum]|uniref:Uncharacterized protein n=1 Tax=Polysphondylium violaceum TaxID=133409 RepID=A0A8J4UZS4_9MYCE|nr:hypothetical protein CYY_003893 [Polysphondylium violaceum]